MKKDDFRIPSAQKYSYVVKILQLVVVLITLALFLFKFCCAYAHVDLHFHSIEWEAEQHMREAREVLVEEWHLQNPETSGEGDENIRQGKEFPL